MENWRCEFDRQWTYQIKEIKRGKVYLKKLTGRKIIELSPNEIPYFEDGKLITPETTDWRKIPIDTKINLSKLLKKFSTTSK